MRDEGREMMRLVDELRRRRIFVSLVMTRNDVKVSFWDEYRHEVRTTDMMGAAIHLKGLRENDRREVEYVGRQLEGRRMAWR